MERRNVEKFKHHSMPPDNRGEIDTVKQVYDEKPNDVYTGRQPENTNKEYLHEF